MNPKQRENLRLLILSTINMARGYGVPMDGIRMGLPPQMRQLDDDDLRAEVQYLIDKGFVALEGKVISPENREWKITAEGRDFLATEGLA